MSTDLMKAGDDWNKETRELVKGMCGKNLNANEFSKFEMLAKQSGLNPLAGELYAIKFGSSEAQIFVGKNGYLKRAGSFDVYDGYSCGYFDEEGIEFTAPLPSKKIVGAWAKVYRKDRKHPTESYVLTSEYDKKQGNWKTMPLFMIKKVAVSQAHREAFISSFAGTYDESERWDDAKVTPKVINKTKPPESIPSPEVTVEVIEDTPVKKKASAEELKKFWEYINKNDLEQHLEKETIEAIDNGASKEELKAFMLEAKGKVQA